jgi:hypothetical protein
MAYKAFFQALNENKGLLNGSIIFWWDNPSSADFYDKRDSKNWGCSWTVREKPAECTIAQAFGGICSSTSSNSHTVVFKSLKLAFCLIFLFVI